MNLSNVSLLAFLTLGYSTMSFAAGSGVDAGSIPSIYEGVILEKGEETEPTWVQMSGNGSQWYATDGAIVGFELGENTQGDQAVEAFKAHGYSNVLFTWDDYASHKTVQIDDKGGLKNFYCDFQYLMTEVYYDESGSDRSIEAFRCRKIKDDYKVSYQLSVRFDSPDGRAVCRDWTEEGYVAESFSKRMYLNGIRYSDTGDNQITTLYCVILEKND
ncbi:hypothetical protein [Marinomonas sp. THO17]|uniref:hypothetical protein n=1 Tax=Marinomonas sp. THO17 TaxID=3149048 RepID=UPI00336BFAB6